MGDIQRFGAAIHHLLTGIVDHLSKLCRCLWFIVLPLWHCFNFYHLSKQTVTHLIWPAEIAERMCKYLIAHHGQQQMFGRNKLIPVFLTVLPSYVQYSRCTFCLSYLCHNCSLFTGFSRFFTLYRLSRFFTLHSSFFTLHSSPALADSSLFTLHSSLSGSTVSRSG